MENRRAVSLRARQMDNHTHSNAHTQKAARCIADLVGTSRHQHEVFKCLNASGYSCQTEDDIELEHFEHYGCSINARDVEN